MIDLSADAGAERRAGGGLQVTLDTMARDKVHRG
jgi:hypothetical protein